MKREPGLDLLRVVGVLFVVSLHQFLYNGFYSQPQTGLLVWVADSFRWLFFCCNGIFIMLTGYLKSPKAFSRTYYRSLVPILVGYVLCCVIIFPLQSQMIDEVLSPGQWLDKFVGFGNYAWYVEMYIGLMLISPLLNLALAQIRDGKQLLMAAGAFVTLSALPSITRLNLIPDYWTSLYPVTYYVLGAVIRRLQPKVKVWQGLGLAMMTCMFLGLLSLASTDKGFSSGFTQGYGGFWTSVVAVFVFLGLYRVQLGKSMSGLFAWLAEGCYEGFMLSLIFDLWAYDLVRQWHTPEKWLLVYVCVTIPILVTSLLLGKLIHKISLGVTNLLPGFRNKAGV